MMEIQKEGLLNLNLISNYTKIKLDQTISKKNEIK